MAKIKEALALLRDYYTNPFNYRYSEDTPYFDEHLHVDHNGNIRGRVKSLRDIMAEAGFPELGAGHYSVVFGVNDNLVLKVNCHNDDAYAHFIEWASCRQSNPYLPRVYYRTTVNTMRVYLLERLEPHDYEDDYQRASLIPSLKHLIAQGLPIKVECPHIAELLTYPGRFDDASGQNIMLRCSTGHPVLSDPCC
jgi:hypothetical protein